VINPQTVGGMKVIIAAPYQVKVKRSWFERLFQRPWQPMRTHNTELREFMKDGEIIMDKQNNVIHCNERTFIKLKDAELRQNNLAT